MSEIQKEKFIKELKNKLNQKTYGNTYEETLLIKAFKYFDLDNKGICDINSFIKTIYKIGVTSFEDEDLKEIFYLFDKDKSGYIDYKEFVSELYDNKSLSKKQKKFLLPLTQENSGKKIPKENEPEICEKATEQPNNIEYTVDDIISIIREKLNIIGVKGICSIARNFRIVDENNSQTVDFNDFLKSCNIFNFGLNDKLMKDLFDSFDKDKTGEIDYDEFIRSIRGEMNEFRQKLVQKAFEILDVNKTGEITFEDLQNKYNADNHPEVLNGKKTEDEIFNEFMDTFQDTYNYLCGTETDNIITIEEFMEYYENVSMTIDDDLYFEYLLNNTWKMGLSVKYKKVEEEKIQKIEVGAKKEEIEKEDEDKKKSEMALGKFVNEIKSLGTTSLITLLKIFKMYDEDNTKEIDYYDFQKALNDFGTELNEDEITSVYNYFDKEKYGYIKYINFINAIRGSLNPKRLAVVKEAFKKLDIDKSGQVELNEIKTQFNFKNDADIKSGKKTEEEIYNEFIESFQMNHDNRVGPRNKRVTLDEFIDYYNYVSMGIDDDLTFISMLQNAWKINPNYIKALLNIPEDNVEEEVSYVHGELKNPKTRVGAAAAPFGTDMTPLTEDYKAKKYFYDLKEKEDNSIVEKFKNNIQKRGIRGIMSMRRAFMIADENDNKTINLPDFIKYFHDYRIPIVGKDINLLFEEFEKGKKGLINYEDFIHAFVKEMNERRKRLIKILFDSFDKYKIGFINLEDLRNCYTPTNHPDVLSGKKTEDEVLAEFLDSLQYHFSLLKSKKENEDKISFEDLCDYYNYISFGIEDDEYFENMIKSGFNLEERRTKKKGWKSII